MIWFAGNGSAEAMAKAIAQNAGMLRRHMLDGSAYYTVQLTKGQFQIAHEIFKLVGKKPTTKVFSEDSPVDKKRIAKVFECHEGFLRSKTTSFCETELGHPTGSSIDITIGFSVYGMGIGRADPPTQEENRPKHPCKVCFESAYPRPELNGKWKASIETEAMVTHANLCPRYKIAKQAFE